MTKLIQKINNIPKNYFSLLDIKKISDINEESLKVAISRLIKNKQLIKLQKGVYTSDISKINWENFAVEIYSPSYLSFEWALNHYNILSQQAVNLTLATTKRSKTITTDKIIIYHHIQSNLFWGYKKENDYLIAEPEKAFLDLAYLSLNGYAKFDIEEINTKELNKTKIKKYLKKFNVKKLDNLISRTH